MTRDLALAESGVAKCGWLLDRAVRTLRALPDSGRRRLKSAWPDYIRDPHDAYGYSEARHPRFKPTPRDVSNMLEVLGWLTWLESQNGGKRDARIIVARAYGVPWWALAQRFGRSERTVQRWHDGAVTRVYAQHVDAVDRMEP